MIAAAVGAATLSGCVAVVLANMDPDQRAKLYVVPPDKAAIYVYREDAIDDAVRGPVMLDGEPVGRTIPRSYLLLMVEPGRHTIETDGGSHRSVALDVQPGRPYFVHHQFRCGSARAHFHLDVVDVATGKAGVKNSVLAEKVQPRIDEHAAANVC